MDKKPVLKNKEKKVYKSSKGIWKGLFAVGIATSIGFSGTALISAKEFRYAKAEIDAYVETVKENVDHREWVDNIENYYWRQYKMGLITLDEFKSKLEIVNNYSYENIIKDYGDYLSNEEQQDCESSYNRYKLYRNTMGVSMLGVVISSVNLITAAKELDKLNELKKIKENDNDQDCEMSD